MSAIIGHSIQTNQSAAQSIRSAIIRNMLKILGVIYGLRLWRYRPLKTLLQAMNGAKSTGVSAFDSISLYETVLKRRPKFILELGAGQSSAVIALAGRETVLNPKFVAVEESEYWIAHHRDVIPSDLLPLIDLTHLQNSATEFEGKTVAHYIGIPRLPYEMVHIDGPDPDAVGAKLTCDIIELLPSLAQSCTIIFDGREASARFAKPHLERVGFRTRRHPFTLSYTFTRD